MVIISPELTMPHSSLDLENSELFLHTRSKRLRKCIWWSSFSLSVHYSVALVINQSFSDMWKQSIQIQWPPSTAWMYLIVIPSFSVIYRYSLKSAGGPSWQLDTSFIVDFGFMVTTFFLFLEASSWACRQICCFFSRSRGNLRPQVLGKMAPAIEDCLNSLKKMDLLPAIWFAFSRVGCDTSALQMHAQRVELVTKEEALRISEAIEELRYNFFSTFRLFLYGSLAGPSYCFIIFCSFKLSSADSDSKILTWINFSRENTWLGEFCSIWNPLDTKKNIK